MTTSNPSDKDFRPWRFDGFKKATVSPGSGLGLTIARAMVEAHRGTLTAQSDGPGQGARFTITLPAGSPRPPG